MTSAFEPIVGRYLNLALSGRPHRLYVEEAGEGIPLVCLHTAGADGRQFRHILNDGAVTRDFRVIVFDMPWHGKSLPPGGFETEEYKLTTAGYTQMVLDICDALNSTGPSSWAAPSAAGWCSISRPSIRAASVR